MLRKYSATIALQLVFLVCGFALLQQRAEADVFSDFQRAVRGSTQSIVDVLSQSVSPGGVRSVEINGENLLVRRFVNPTGDDSAFYSTWKRVAADKMIRNRNITALLDRSDPFYDSVVQGVPHRSLVDNLDYVLDASSEFAERLSADLKEAVVTAVEAPFTYETEKFRVIALMPLSMISRNTLLVSAETSSGLLFLAEKVQSSTISKAFWQIQFDQNFLFADFFGKEGQDVGGVGPKIPRYPGSTMTLVFSENTNGWSSDSWSYESTGDVLSHINHYLNAFDMAGFERESRTLLEADYGLVQFSSSLKEASLFVELIDQKTQKVQVTLQIRGS